ncbi:MAG: NADH-quinone oxidoreductase subunit C, partial [Actinomycetota bacterium]
VEVRHGHVWAKTAPDRVLQVVESLKTEPDLDCGYLTFLSAVDWQEEGFEVVIALFSYRYLNTVILGIRLPAENPRMPSITGIFGGANWHEREAAEMFGIKFDGHPNPVKLYLPEDFEGYPLRKSFGLASRTYKEWPGAKDPDEAKAGGR